MQKDFATTVSSHSSPGLGELCPESRQVSEWKLQVQREPQKHETMRRGGRWKAAWFREVAQYTLGLGLHTVAQGCMDKMGAGCCHVFDSNDSLGPEGNKPTLKSKSWTQSGKQLFQKKDSGRNRKKVLTQVFGE